MRPWGDASPPADEAPAAPVTIQGGLFNGIPEPDIRIRSKEEIAAESAAAGSPDGLDPAPHRRRPRLQAVAAGAAALPAHKGQVYVTPKELENVEAFPHTKAKAAKAAGFTFFEFCDHVFRISLADHQAHQEIGPRYSSLPEAPF